MLALENGPYTLDNCVRLDYWHLSADGSGPQFPSCWPVPIGPEVLHLRRLFLPYLLDLPPRCGVCSADVDVRMPLEVRHEERNDGLPDFLVVDATQPLLTFLVVFFSDPLQSSSGHL